MHTGSYENASSHPFGLLYEHGFNVSINTDNRLMSSVSVSDEYLLAATTFGLDRAAIGTITANAIEAGFGDWPSRKALIDDVVKPAYGLS